LPKNSPHGELRKPISVEKLAVGEPTAAVHVNVMNPNTRVLDVIYSMAYGGKDNSFHGEKPRPL